MLVDIPNNANVQVESIKSQVDVTQIVAASTAAAVLTIYSNIASPGYLDLFGLCMYAVPSSLGLAGTLNVSGTSSFSSTITTGGGRNVPGVK